MPFSYQHPLADDPPGMTRYQVFVGPGTALEHPGLTFEDFPDDTSHTLLVVEAAQPVFWAEPRDLAYDPNGPLPALGAGYATNGRFLCYRVRGVPVFHACLADGSVRWFRTTIEEPTMRGLITRNGGEPIDAWKE
jgi:hypothetical protein